MTIDIWSDIRCPFCYIGKHHFEKALEQYAHKDEVQVRWHSFQLDPDLKTQPGVSTLDHFVHQKQVSEEKAREMFQAAQQMASDTGLTIDFDSAIVANSRRAHLLLQLSKEKGLATELKETLFQAHFSMGENIDDPEILTDLAEKVGLSRSEAEIALESEEFAYAVKQDQMQAQQIGIRGVPFFIVDDKYALSGAQPVSAFLEVLEKVKPST